MTDERLATPARTHDKACGSCGWWRYERNSIYSSAGNDMPWRVDVPFGTDGNDVDSVGKCVAPLPDCVIEVDCMQFASHDATACPCWKAKE